MHEAGTATVHPAWNAIHEEIACPLCDYNLRGLEEPRCPECGFRFNWPDVLDPSRRKHPFLFEHHPERIVWSYWRTLRASLRPWKFWRSLHPAQPSRPKRLVIYWLVPTFLFIGALTANFLVQVLSLVQMQRTSRAWAVAYYNNPANSAMKVRLAASYGSFQAYLDQDYAVSFGSALRIIGNEAFGPLAVACVCGAGWPWLTLAALLVFQISMHHARIRSEHVLRCVIYASGPAIWIEAMILAVLSLGQLVLSPAQPGRSPAGAFLALAVFGGISLMAVATCAVHWLLCIWAAYREYLKFDRPFLTILASQVIVGLIALNLILAVRYY